MIPKLRKLFCLVPLTLLAGCNFPNVVNQIIESQLEPTPTELSLEQIEAIVAATLAVEVQSDAPGDELPPTDEGENPLPDPETATPSLTPSATATPTHTATHTATPVPARCTVLAQALNMRYGPGTVYAPPIVSWSQGTEFQPLSRNPDSTWVEAEELVQSTVGWVSANPDLLECNIAVSSLAIGIIPPTPTPSYTPTPSNTPTPTPTDTPKPSSTPCPKFTNGRLTATVNRGDNSVSLAWASSGGCGPITGTLTATYKGDPSPYARYDNLKGGSGKLTDEPEPRCEGTFSIVYTLVLTDGSGQTITVNTSASVTWIC